MHPSVFWCYWCVWGLILAVQCKLVLGCLVCLFSSIVVSQDSLAACGVNSIAVYDK